MISNQGAKETRRIRARSDSTGTSEQSRIQAMSWNTEAHIENPEVVEEEMARQPSLSAQNLVSSPDLSRRRVALEEKI